MPNTTDNPAAEANSNVQEHLREYLDDYVMTTEGADYVPTEHERGLIEDAIQGLLADGLFPAKVAAWVNAMPSVR